MFTLPKENTVNINNKLYALINNKWAWFISFRYNTNDTITVYSLQFITK